MGLRFIAILVPIFLFACAGNRPGSGERGRTRIEGHIRCASPEFRLSALTVSAAAGTEPRFLSLGESGVGQDGSYWLKLADDASYPVVQLRLDLPGFGTLSTQTTSIEPGNVRQVDFDLAVASVPGSVLDGTTNKPVPGAQVVTRSPGGAIVSGAVTDADGSFSLAAPKVKKGWLEVLVQHPEYGRATTEKLGLSHPPSSLTVRMSRWCLLAGHVKDRDGKPIRGASVQVVGMARSDDADGGVFHFPTVEGRQETNSAGYFELHVPWAAEWKVRVQAESPEHFRAELDITPDQREIRVGFTLQKGYVLQGKVEGGPPGSVAVEVSDPGKKGECFVFYTESGGAFRGLVPEDKEYEAVVSGCEGFSTAGAVRIRPGTPVTLRLKAK